MAKGMEKVGIVGAASLLGKELAEAVGESVLAAAEIVLLDGEEMSGQVTPTGDEVVVIQQLDATSFEGMDVVFFAGDATMTRSHWQAARQAGVSIVDLTGGLASEPEVLVLAPWVEEMLASTGASRKAPDLNTPAVVAAHPAAAMLALVGARLGLRLQVASIAATVLEPASEHGKAAMDELHEQTVKLLSFQPLPKEQYDAQVAFNLLPATGEEAKIRTAETQQLIVDQYLLLSTGRLPQLTVQLVHAPVFHGLTASVLVDLAKPATVAQVEAALGGAYLDVVAEASEPPSNLSAAGQGEVLVRVMAGWEPDAQGEGEERGTRFWLWLAADNMRLAALNGLACAFELRRLRPRGTVQ